MLLLLGFPVFDLPDEWVWLYNTCRAINAPLQALAAVGVSYRLLNMALDRPRWQDRRARHISLWFAWVTVSLFTGAIASNYYASTDIDANAASVSRTLLTLSAIVLTLWWPHPKSWSPVER